MKYISFFLINIFILNGCKNDGTLNYQKLIETELSKNSREDELLYGLRFGMTKEEFYDHCRRMNKNGLFFNSAGNAAVVCRIQDEFKSPVKVSFYPEFIDNKIYKLPAIINYEAFAPWNKNLFADSLVADLLQFFNKKFGQAPLLQMTDPNNKNVFVRVDANRRITITKKDERETIIEFTDLLIEKKISKNAQPF